jgi:cytochrome c556
MKAISAGALLAIAGAASAQVTPEQAERVVDTRQSVLTLMAWNISPLGGMARDRIPFDAERVATNAERILALSKMLPDAFAPDTRGTGVKTDALDLIWEDADAFAEKLRANEEAAAALVEVAGSGDEAAMREAIGRLGSTCGSCHDDFKAD